MVGAGYAGLAFARRIAELRPHQQVVVLGRLLAEQALGEDNPLIADAASLGRAGYLPPRPMLDIGVKGFMARERWRSRSEL